MLHSFGSAEERVRNALASLRAGSGVLVVDDEERFRTTLAKLLTAKGMQVSVAGGTPQRITFQGQYNAKASVSYDGKQIAMVQGSGNVYRITIQDQSLGGQQRFVSPGPLDDSVSFAPNASMLLYSATEGSRGVLYSVSSDGMVRDRLRLAEGNVQEPAWGPYREP